MDKTAYLLTCCDKGEGLSARRVFEVSDWDSALDTLYVLIRGGAVDIRIYKTQAF